MLAPAILYKDQIEHEFAKRIYDPEYFFYTGYGHCHEVPTIAAKDGRYDYAITDLNDNLIGFFSYSVYDVASAENFGLYSFDKGNPLVTAQVYREMHRIVRSCRRVTWKVISGNPVKRLYDRFCQRYNGKVHRFREVISDSKGVYHDEYIYEILKSDWNM